MKTSIRKLPLLLLAAGFSLAVGPCPETGLGLPFFRFEAPLYGQLSELGPLGFELRVPRRARTDQLSVELDGQPLDPAGFARDGDRVSGALPELGEGLHVLRASLALRPFSFLPAFRMQATTWFELIPALANADQCEVLNRAECWLPFPSSRFLVPADTPTSYRLDIPEVGSPKQVGVPVPTEQFSVLDGFSPGAQILMNFPVPAGVDLEASRAATLVRERRTYDDRSLDRDSPTVLVDLTTGERVLHFVELDARQTDPLRQLLFVRPAESLVPGHRYAVAVRSLVDGQGEPVPPEPVYAALRNRRPTTIPAVEARRAGLERLFHDLRRRAQVPRWNLILAFEFQVQSEQGLAGQMLSMRDQAFAWLDEQEKLGVQTFTVDPLGPDADCADPDTLIWRIVEGSYQVPLFLTADLVALPEADTFLNVDADGRPVQNGFTNAPYTIAIPCAVLDEEVARPLVIGHGLFGDGRSTIRGLVADELTDEVRALGFESFPYLAGATDWRGLSRPDRTGPSGDIFDSWIVTQVVAQLGKFAQLPARLRQGQLNTLILARMMRGGLFNQDPAFRTPSGAGVFPGRAEPQFYFGASLGGVMGLMFAALSPDVERVSVDVPSTNFEFLVQRATPFLPFEQLLAITGIAEPTELALGISLIGQLWVRGESAGYARHITRDPFPGTNPKRVLMTEAWLDQQVSNLGTEIAARTLGLPNLKRGSLVSGQVGIPDRSGPLASALVVYDTGSFDLDDPEDAPFVPPLANQQAEPNRCDPHGLRGFIPASLRQLIGFLQPDGLIENFCNGDCDAAEPLELPFGLDAPCDPQA